MDDICSYMFCQVTECTRLDQSLTLTLLPNLAAQSAESVTLGIASWVDLFNDTTAKSKAALPMIFGGTLGTLRSAKNSLRHGPNITAITCIVGDYDGEIVAMGDAVERLEIRDISAILYQSARWTAAKPRWRVVCPLSAPRPPSDHGRMVAILDAALGRILADESFVAAQSFYYGRLA